MNKQLLHNKTVCNFIIFGTCGDLATRKLLPALYQLEKAHLLDLQCTIIGVARHHMTTQAYQQYVYEALTTHLNAPVNIEIWQRMQAKLDFVQIDLDQINQYQSLRSKLSDNPTIFYYAIPPSLFGTVSDALAQNNLIQTDSRVIVEKPIGHDLNSSITTNDKLAKHFNEQQIYRIDHYLGKETIQNLLVLRFANPILKYCWHHEAIDHVQITIAETLGIEGRWQFYDATGQLLDMVQNHILQIIALLAMEPPQDLEADSIRDKKVALLKSIQTISANHIVRGQYHTGDVNQTTLPGYRQECSQPNESMTETFVAARLDINNDRWKNVPFYIRTGKRLKQKLSAITIHFKPNKLFATPPSKLVIQLQPDEGISLELINKQPGLEPTLKLRTQSLASSFCTAKEKLPDAYEHLLFQAMIGNQALFVRRDEIETAWDLIDGIKHIWQKEDSPLHPYPAGSWGPNAATSLLKQDRRQWEHLNGNDTIQNCQSIESEIF